MMLMDRQQIASMIPHAGTMCLLDAVLSWNAVSVRCLSRQCRNADNPLRRADGCLGAVCGVEIAAQAMAVHGRLVAGGSNPPVHGYLASVRDVRLRVSCLDDIASDLIIDAERLMGDAQGAAYQFALASAGIELVTGRATVLFRVTG